MDLTSPRNMHAVALDSYMQQLLRRQFHMESDDDLSGRGRSADNVGHSARVARSDERLNAMEFANSRESRPNNLIQDTDARRRNDSGNARHVKMRNEDRERLDNRPGDGFRRSQLGDVVSSPGSSTRGTDVRGLTSSMPISGASGDSWRNNIARSIVNNHDGTARNTGPVMVRDGSPAAAGHNVGLDRGVHTSRGLIDQSVDHIIFSREHSLRSKDHGGAVSADRSVEAADRGVQPRSLMVETLDSVSRSMEQVNRAASSLSSAVSPRTAETANLVSSLASTSSPRELGNRVGGSRDNTVSPRDRTVSGEQNGDGSSLGHLPNQSQVFSRLMDIRDYIQQSTALLDAIGNARDKKSVDQRDQLTRMLTQLRSEEKDYLQLLHHIMGTQRSQQQASLIPNGDDESVRDSETDTVTDRDDMQPMEQQLRPAAGHAKPRNGHESSMEQLKLLEKMLQQQQQLRELQCRQEMLLQLQSESEQRLAVSGISRQQPPQQQLRQQQPMPRNAETSSVSGSEAGVAGGRVGIRNVRNLAVDNEELSTAEDDGCSSAVAESAASVQERQNLEDKLKELQLKKQQMDQLLEELQSLKDRELLNNASVSSSLKALTGQQLNDSLRATAAMSSSAQKTAEQAEDVLSQMEAQQKYKKLREMREKLEQLKQLEQNLHAAQMAQLEWAQTDGDDSDGAERRQDLDRLADDLESRSLAQRRIDVETDAPQPRDFKSVPADMAECDSMTDYEQMSQDNPEIQDKVRQLKAAKEKLHTLQELVAQIQRFPDLASMLPDDLSSEVNQDSDLVAGPVANTAQEQRDAAAYRTKMQQQREELAQLTAERQKLLMMQDHLCRLQESLALAAQETELKTQQASRPAADTNSPSAESKQTLPDGALTAAGRRPPVDGAAASLHVKSSAGAAPPARHSADRNQHISAADSGVRLPVYGAVGGGDKHQISSSSARVDTAGGRDGLTGTRAKVPAPVSSSAATQVTFQDPLETVVSNEELYDRMRQQRMLREELREKKKELEDMMRKEHSSKQNSRNQDTQSDVVSYSNKSDQFGASASEDYTMATWGGSTAGNLESIEENYRSDDDDDDDDDNRDNDDDEDDNDDQQDNNAENAFLRSGVHIEDDEPADEVGNDDDDEMSNADLISAARSRRLVHPVDAGSSRDRSQHAAKESRENHTDWTISGSRVVNNVQGQRSHGIGQQREWNETRPNVDGNAKLNAVCNDIKWLRNQMSSLMRTVDKSAEEKAISGAHATVQQQMQQNQLVLSLNQSYFQLVSNQNALIERFNRLESLVLGSAGASSSPRDERQDGCLAVEGTRRYQSVWKPCQAAAGSNAVKREYDRNSSLIKTETTDSVVIETVHARDSQLQDVGLAEASARHNECGNAADRASTSSLPGSCAAGDREHDVAASQDAFSRGDVENESMTSGNVTAFDALRETIYAEVATLISQNEMSPHYLIELFRQLQLLSTDFLRQRALYSIQDIVSRYFAKRKEGPWKSDDVNELTSANLLNSRNVAKLSPVIAAGDNEGFDYVETAESSESLSQSTISDVACWDTPFAQDSLGDTVIHFDTVLRKMREQMPKLTSQAAGVPLNGNTNTGANSSGDRMTGVMDASMPRAQQDKGSDGSLSDATCSAPTLDTRQLDHEIKEIMMQIIPVVKQHMNGICTQQLLHYIQQLTLSLTRLQQLQQQQQQQMPSRGTRPDEFSKFFRRQLDTILRDSLAKFEGRKMSECGEDLLVDLSEILFNELAFFRLMQDLDTSKAKVKAKLKTFEKMPHLAKDMKAALSGDDAQNAEQQHDMLSTPSPDTSSSESVSSKNAEHRMAEMCESVDDTLDEDDTVKDDDVDKFMQHASEPLNDEDDDDGDDDDDDDDDDNDDDDNDNVGNEEDDNDDNEDQKDVGNGDLKSSKTECHHGAGDELTCSRHQIQLAPSETKPCTRIGSDEDEDDGDEEASVDDPSETAVSRDAAKEVSSSSASDMEDCAGHQALSAGENGPTAEISNHICQPAEEDSDRQLQVNCATPNIESDENVEQSYDDGH